MPITAVQSWSLQRTLGAPVADGAFPWPGGMTPHRGPGLDLLDLPAQLAAHGYNTLQLCHFQLPTRDPGYLSNLRAALLEHHIHLDALLLDTGDLSSPDQGDEQQRWARGWIADALTLGADRIRLIGGRQSPDDRAAIPRSAARFRQLANDNPAIRIVTENWHELLCGPQQVLQFLEQTEGQIGLLIDLANWAGPRKYDDLRTIAGAAETCHAKCGTLPDRTTLDREDYLRCLTILADAGFDGPLALVYTADDPDEWAGMADERRIVRQVFPAA